jgi:hypothetical protein
MSEPTLCNCGPCQREAAARNAPIPYLCRTVAEAIFDALDESQRAREVLPIHTKADVDAAARAVLAVVTPELERRDAEIGRLNDVRLNSRVQWRADLDEIADALGLEKDLPTARIVHWAKDTAAERDSLRADMGIRHGALNGVLGRSGNPSPSDYYEAIDQVADLVNAARRLARRGSESVPATPGPVRDRLSVVAHPGLDFPDCLTDYAQGQVSAYERAIEECEGWAHHLDRAYAAPYLDVARWLEGRVGWFRERAAQAQSGVDLAVAEAAPRAEFAPGAVVKWTGDTGWFVGRIIGPTSADTLRSAGLSFPGEKVWDAEVTDLGTFYAGKDHQLGATVHLTEERIEFAQDDEPLSEEFLTLARKAHAEIEGHLAENPVPSPAASADTTPARDDECGALEGMTGIECDRYPGHQDWHSGKHTPRTDGTESVGYPVHIQWPRMDYDRCAPASSTFREGDREPQPDVRFVRGSRSGRTYERRSDGYGGHWDYQNGDGISWRVWEALLREERSVQVLPNTEHERPVD